VDRSSVFLSQYRLDSTGPAALLIQAAVSSPHFSIPIKYLSSAAAKFHEISTCHSTEYVAVSRGLLTTKPADNIEIFSVQYWTTHPRFKLPKADITVAMVADTIIISKTSNNSKDEVLIFSLPMQASVHCTEF
jgi:hypothetical protein